MFAEVLLFSVPRAGAGAALKLYGSATPVAAFNAFLLVSYPAFYQLFSRL
jgi:hypothetical protein